MEVVVTSEAIIGQLRCSRASHDRDAALTRVAQLDKLRMHMVPFTGFFA